jgi:hypothetical protein
MDNFLNNGPKILKFIVRVRIQYDIGHLNIKGHQYTITALGRGEYLKLSTPLGLFPRGL